MMKTHSSTWHSWQLLGFVAHLAMPLVGMAGLICYAQQHPALLLALASSQLPTQPDLIGWFFALGGTAVVAIADRAKDNRLPLSTVTRRVMWLVTVLICAALAVAWAIADSPRRWVVVMLALLAVTYPLAQSLASVKTIATAIAWAITAVLLPHAHAAERGLTLLWPVMLQVAAVVAIAALLCDVKDQQRDQGNIASALVIWGWTGHWLLLTAACTLAVWWQWYYPSRGMQLCLAGLIAISFAPRLLRRPLLAPILIDAWLVTTWWW